MTDTLFFFLLVLSTGFFYAAIHTSFHIVHKYKLESKQQVDIYGDGFGGMRNSITGRETNFLYLCTVCEKVKVKTVKGSW